MAQPQTKREDSFLVLLGQRLAQLENELADTKAQLESTEKAYDISLQQNLDLVAKLDTYRNLKSAKMYGMGPQRFGKNRLHLMDSVGKIDETIAERSAIIGVALEDAKAGEPVKLAIEQDPTPALDESETFVAGDEPVTSDDVLAVNAFLNHPTAPDFSVEAARRILQGANVSKIVDIPPRHEMSADQMLPPFPGGDNVVFIDDPFVPHDEPTNAEALLWYDLFGPGADDPEFSPSSYPKVISGLRRINADQVRRRKEAQGQRALMKDTLSRTQNACRKYKARLARQKTQLAALQDLANAAFPLYTALSSSLRSSDAEAAEFLIVGRIGQLQHQLEDFHNKFNQAAETLSYD